MSIDSVAGWLATGFGLGHLPLLAGTAGAVLGLLFAVALDRLHWRRRLLAVIALVALAVPPLKASKRRAPPSSDAPFRTR